MSDTNYEEMVRKYNEMLRVYTGKVDLHDELIRLTRHENKDVWMAAQDLFNALYPDEEIPPEHGITNYPNPWRCICGEQFTNVEEAFRHGFAAGQDSVMKHHD